MTYEFMNKYKGYAKALEKYDKIVNGGDVNMEIRIKYFEGAKELEINPKGNCIDVYANKDVFIPQFEMKLIPLGFAMELPKGKIARLFPRSSTFKTWGCIQSNSVGIVDETYKGDRDEWKVPLICITPKDTMPVELGDNGLSFDKKGTWVRKGDKIAQFEIVDAMKMPTFKKVDMLGNENRGGFGSTSSR